MILVCGMAEFLSTFIEGFAAYLVFADIFRDKRKRGDRKTDIVPSVLGTILILFCNQFALFSYLTLVIVGIFLYFDRNIEQIKKEEIEEMPICKKFPDINAEGQEAVRLSVLLCIIKSGFKNYETNLKIEQGFQGF